MSISRRSFLRVIGGDRPTCSSILKVRIMKTDRREFIRTMALGVAAAATAGCVDFAYAKPANKPNVVVVFVDDLGWTDLSCYGSTFHETPNIDRLAKQGAMFTRAYASCCVCSPTRASLLTGKYPQRVGFTDFLNPSKRTGRNSSETHIPVGDTTIGEAFQQAGYRTGYIGKWHVGSEKIGMPKQHGFDWQWQRPSMDCLHRISFHIR